MACVISEIGRWLSIGVVMQLCGEIFTIPNSINSSLLLLTAENHDDRASLCSECCSADPSCS